MAKYTEVLHDLLENETTSDLITKALSKYPIYEPVHDELYGYIPTREELNTKILNYYRWYEIGSETVGRFLFNLENTMNLIMPYYNQMYKSIDVMNGIEDIFGNLDVVEMFEEDRTNESTDEGLENVSGTSRGETKANTSDTTNSSVESTNTTNNNMNSNGRDVKATTPQSQLVVKSIDNITAASEINWNENNSNSTSTSNDTSTSSGTNTGSSTGESETESTQETINTINRESSGKTTHTLSRKGNQGVNTYAHDMLEFRQLFINIEEQIIHDPELAKCFMLIW